MCSGAYDSAKLSQWMPTGPYSRLNATTIGSTLTSFTLDHACMGVSEASLQVLGCRTVSVKHPRGLGHAAVCNSECLSPEGGLEHVLWPETVAWHAVPGGAALASVRQVAAASTLTKQVQIDGRKGNFDLRHSKVNILRFAVSYHAKGL